MSLASLAPEVLSVVRSALDREGLVVALTGAGVSAASGIPTFRGPQGWWTVGSQRYTPQELATRAMFERDPAAVWSWYLHRLRLVRGAEPNAAHRALAGIEAALGERFLLVTQNVDGLHRRAGSRRVFEVHGRIDRLRCAGECSPEHHPLPAELADGADGGLEPRHRAALACPACGGWLRPHVLWFDEAYDEQRYRIDSTLAAAEQATLLLTIGTSGATTLPALLVRTAAAAGARLVDVNPERNPFADAAREQGGAEIRATATEALPLLAEAIVARPA